jgi:hypothetical protein
MRPSSNSTATSRASTSLTRPLLPRGIPGRSTTVSTASPISSISPGSVHRCWPPARSGTRPPCGKRAPPRRPPAMRSAMAGGRLLDWSCRLDIASRRSDSLSDGPMRPRRACRRLPRRLAALEPSTVSTTEPPPPITAALDRFLYAHYGGFRDNRVSLLVPTVAPPSPDGADSAQRAPRSAQAFRQAVLPRTWSYSLVKRAKVRA